MKKHILWILPLLVLWLLPQRVNGQVNRCALNLIEAKEKYAAGQIQEVPKLLLDCINQGFTYDDRIGAYKLLINAYIFDDNIEAAERYMLEFLDNFPDYEPTSDDPFEFVTLFDQYDNEPGYSLGGFLGTNLCMVRVTEPFGVNSVNEINGDYKIAPGFNLGGQFNYYLGSKTELSLEPMFSSKKIKYEVNPFSFTRTEYLENQGRFELPVSLVYKLSRNEISPYIRLGFMSSMMVSAKAESSRTYTNTGGVSIDDISGSRVDIIEKRNHFNIAGLIGGGLRYELDKAYFFFDVRYNLGLNGLVDPESRRDAADDNIWLYYNVQDDFVMNDIAFSFGYVKVFYKTKRKN